MIMRIWKGSTHRSDSDSYYEYLQETGVKEYRKTTGNHGVYVLRRNVDDRSEFLLLSLWDSFESIKRFAGSDYEKAVFYPEDTKYLVKFDKHVEHFEVLSSDLKI
ncbi:MAG: antibiotic biosynthesis monooxygenase [Candidatus Marinimicrobia bacterium]|nr:antibiotic biosynthesis monooxygenase [Candidatus Neomarinimicrobiota bacterium]